MAQPNFEHDFQARPAIPERGKSEAPWKRIPQLLNFLRYHFTAKSENVLEYDPFHLKVFSDRQYVRYGERFYLEQLTNQLKNKRRLSKNDLDLEAFKFAVHQLPGVGSVEFSGWGEPLLNPEIFKMIHYVHDYTKAQVTLFTKGLLIEKHLNNLVTGPEEIVVTMFGHRPATYYTMTGLDAQNFVPIVENVKKLVKARNQAKSDAKIYIQLVVDLHHYTETLEMIKFAKQLGVDGVWIENYDVAQKIEDFDTRALFDDQRRVVAYFDTLTKHFARHMNEEMSDFWIKLPTLLKRDMSQHRYCRDPFSTVGIDGDCNVYPCSKRAIQPTETAPMGKVWDEDFWNNKMYQWLRSVHQTDVDGLVGVQTHCIPEACKTCPNNLG